MSAYKFLDTRIEFEVLKGNKQMKKDAEGTLYILGNGLDCFHRLDTSPDTFLKILKMKTYITKQKLQK